MPPLATISCALRLDVVAELVVERLVHLVQEQHRRLRPLDTAKPSRARIPCEYVTTGRSKCSPRRLRSRTSGTPARASAGDSPASTPSRSACSRGP
jgi:hypothetical protein